MSLKCGKSEKRVLFRASGKARNPFLLPMHPQGLECVTYLVLFHKRQLKPVNFQNVIIVYCLETIRSSTSTVSHMISMKDDRDFFYQ